MSKILAGIIIIVSHACYSQKVQDVLEHGKKVNDFEKIFLRFDGSKLEYHTGLQYNVLDLKTFEDSLLLLPTNDRLNFYIRPLNPLNYSTKAEVVEVIDQINLAANEAIVSITQNLTSLPIQQLKKVVENVKNDSLDEGDCGFQKLVERFDPLIKNVFNSNRSENILAVFRNLENLDFDSEDNTRKGLADAVEKILKFESEIKQMDEEVKTLSGSLESIETSTCENVFKKITTKLILANAIEEAKKHLQNQNDLVIKLRSLYATMKSVETTALRYGWLLKLDEIKSSSSKISLITLRVNSGGYEISDGKFSAIPEKEKISKVIRVRKFQRFVPEVSTGIAYTNLSYPKYGATTDDDGLQTVTSAGNENISRLNFSVMLNYNLFLTNTLLHPFWQIGVGANKEIPTLLSGVGIRISGSKVNRLALSFGLAASWIKDLDKLSIGSEISGQADIEKDLSYTFTKHPKFYLGIQYNF